MDYPRLALAALGAFVAALVFGGIVFVSVPALKNEFQKYPDVMRPREGMMSLMPIGMVAMLISMLVLAVLYAMVYRPGYGLAEGARLGALIGVFVIFAFVVKNYVNFNLGWKLTLYTAVAYLLEWTVAGIAVGLIYKPK